MLVFPFTPEAEARGPQVQGQSWQLSMLQIKSDPGYSLVIKHSSSMHESLGSVPSTVRKRKVEKHYMTL